MGENSERGGGVVVPPVFLYPLAEIINYVFSMGGKLYGLCGVNPQYIVTVYLPMPLCKAD